MKQFRLPALFVALFAAMTLIAGCEKKEAAPAPAPKAEAPAPAPAPAPAAPAPAAAPASQGTSSGFGPAPTAAAPAAEAAPAAANAALPAECEGYLTQIKACAEKQSSNTAMADALKQQMDQTRTSWAQITDKAALGAACKQAADAFAQHAKSMGC